jgi:heptosyltransferase-1
MSSPKRLLLVKLSSLGDVIHNLPVATDIRKAFPDAEIDWVTEAPYAPLVAAHPAVRQVWPVRLRALKSRWFAPSAWSQFIRDRAQLSGKNYDLVIDTQGLTKSAVIARASGQSIAGYDRDSIREPFAARWYQRHFPVSRQLHAVDRNRALAAAALGYEHADSCDYGLPTEWPNSASVSTPYAVCLHATSRADKCWPADQWIALGGALNRMGLHIVLPSGNDAEFAQSSAIASKLDSATPLALKPLVDTAALLAGAALVIGVDTGLAHLAVALKRPTIGLYLTTEPALTGLYAGGGAILNMGGGTRAQPTTIATEDVAAAARDMLQERA